MSYRDSYSRHLDRLDLEFQVHKILCKPNPFDTTNPKQRYYEITTDDCIEILKHEHTENTIPSSSKQSLYVKHVKIIVGKVEGFSDSKFLFLKILKYVLGDNHLVGTLELLYSNVNGPMHNDIHDDIVLGYNIANIAIRVVCGLQHLESVISLGLPDKQLQNSPISRFGLVGSFALSVVTLKHEVRDLKLLFNNGVFENLDISFCFVDQHFCDDLAFALGCSTSLRCLVLKYNNATYEYYKFENIFNNGVFESLDIVDKNVEKGDLQELGVAFRNSKTLRKLSICGVGETFVPHNFHNETINRGSCGVFESFRDVFHNGTFRCLKLNDLNLNTNDVHSLADVLNLKTIKRLDISHNHLPNIDFGVFSQMFEFGIITTLKLDYTGIGDKELECLMRVIQNSKTLKRLFFRLNKTTFHHKFLEMLPNSLKCIDMRNSRIEIPTIVELFTQNRFATLFMDFRYYRALENSYHFENIFKNNYSLLSINNEQSSHFDRITVRNKHNNILKNVSLFQLLISEGVLSYSVRE